ncbi:MAG: hypothetical protein Q4A74_08485 [Cardiobacteriaceae bacterium]|nr:hypothetical protein [Cardiobacteriaceae bacterium]
MLGFPCSLFLGTAFFLWRRADGAEVRYLAMWLIAFIWLIILSGVFLLKNGRTACGVLLFADLIAFLLYCLAL